MKRLLILLFSIELIFSLGSCNAQKSQDGDKPNQKSGVDKVQVYYFHGTHRCATCKAVGRVSRELVESKYGDNEKVEFIEIDYDVSGNEELVEKFDVTSSGLYVYNGEEDINLTAFAFQYARTDPDKLRNRLIKLINKNL
ncbi:MAG: hypothetical protein B6D61_07715 [Bacteroidetes bacterium 4484_249]|nr:MAG: hypothetical protein B6D61_07715 [Bacteroidetes bacterium 4484_249]